jgi:hypothetical protein
MEKGTVGPSVLDVLEEIAAIPVVELVSSRCLPHASFGQARKEASALYSDLALCRRDELRKLIQTNKHTTSNSVEQLASQPASQLTIDL